MPEAYSREAADRRLWEWLTRGGTIEPGTSGPLIDTEATAAPSAGAKTNVNDTATSTTILAANTSRKMAVIWNDSTVALYLDLSGGTASATSFSVKLAADQGYVLPVPVYTGLITGIWASDASGAARITEFV